MPSNERFGSVMDAAKQFLDEVKMEEERPLAGGADTNGDDMEKRNDQHSVLPAVESIEDDYIEGSVTCNKVIEDKQNDPSEGLVTCNKVVEQKQNDPNEGSVTCNEAVEDKQNAPIEGSMTCNKENTSSVDGTTAEPSIGELAKEKAKSEKGKTREKSEPPADFLSSMIQCYRSSSNNFVVTAQDVNSWMAHAGKPIDFTELLPLVEDKQIQRYLSKYWSQRYRLFMKYDGGIKMDRGMV